MQLASADQIVNILPAAAKDSARFIDIDDPKLHEVDEILQGEGDAVAFLMEFTIRQHRPVTPHDAIPVGLDFDGIKAFFPRQIRFAFRICICHRAHIGNPYFTVTEEDEQPISAQWDDVLNLALPAIDQKRRKIGRVDFLKIAIVLCTASHGEHEELKLIVLLKSVLFQDLADVLANESGAAIINNSKIKLLLPMDKKEAEAVSGVIELTSEEMKQLKRTETQSATGKRKASKALMVANSNHIFINIKASKTEHDLITTSADDLQRIKKQMASESN